MQRINTNIRGLDNLIEGGVPKSMTLLLSGSAGSGKTILSLQYLCKAAELGEKVVFISFEMLPEHIIEQAAQFGWDITQYIEKGTFLLRYYDLNAVHVSKVLNEITNILTKHNPSRLVIDSLTVLGVYAEVVETSEVSEIMGFNDNCNVPSNAITRRTITNLIRMLDSHPVTSIVTSELSNNSQWLSRDTISEFICDGVILLKTHTMGRSLTRTLEVRKMRLTKIRGGEYGFTFSNEGILINI